MLDGRWTVDTHLVGCDVIFEHGIGCADDSDGDAES